VNQLQVDQIIRRALEEDIGHGDITTDNLVPPDQQSQGVMLAKEDGVIAGLEVAGRVFALLDAGVGFEALIQDGNQIHTGQHLARLSGPTRALLTGERTALNLLQRMSGIATRTWQLCRLIQDQKARIVDTRKTTPGLRLLEKYAVQVGGGRNHRFGLFDAVLIKDNHIRAAGGITPAVTTVRSRVPHTTRIEVEVADLDMLREALAVGADIIMLDNMSVEAMQEAVEITAGRALLEASGGINEQTLAAVAAAGVDYISIGALTHSAPALDISLDLL
jgi:nicotinate-nucleotide pyrophosphorylase (carboxylating)